MTILFSPSQLGIARGADLFRRTVDEVFPPSLRGELRVLQNARGEPTRLVLVASGSRPASIDVPHSWIYTDLREDDVRSRLLELLDKAEGGIPQPA